MNSDQLVNSLERLIAYSQVNNAERDVLRSAISAIKTPSDLLNEALPNLSTLDALLTCLVNPDKFKHALAQLGMLVKEANAARRVAAQTAAELDAKAAEIEPKLAAAKEEHAAKLAEAQAAFDRRVADFQRQLSMRQAEIADLEKAAKADADAAAELRADLAARLERVRSAAA